MFTGLIEELGTVVEAVELEPGRRLRIECPQTAFALTTGASVAVNGVCLTALDIDAAGFAAELSPETLYRTTLGRTGIGAKVNLELAVTPSTRLGGHIVQGHVDGRGTFWRADEDGDFWTVTIGFPANLARYFVEKGSVAVEGISLTIAALRDTEFDIAVIPKTWEMTNLSTLKPKDDVNIEVDVIAKYVERMIQFR